jgi:hypothetical protein
MLKYYYSGIKLIENLINLGIVIFLNFKNIGKKNKLPKTINNTVHILGNGPSLKSDINKVLERKKNASILTVNAFAITEVYETIRPNMYLIVDPDFFRDTNDDRVRGVQNKTLEALIKKTKWKLFLFIPYSANKSFFVQDIQKKNKKISIIYFLNIPIIGGHSSLNNFFFKKNLANPLYINVLIASIFLCVKMKFSKIIVWGADHSWHEGYRLGKDNYIYRTDGHFVKAKEFTETMKLKKEDGTPTKLYEEFFNFATVFKIYHSLEIFSKKENVEIVNLSSYTWIDAFKRFD